jgi:hypothetical protein
MNKWTSNSVIAQNLLKNYTKDLVYYTISRELIILGLEHNQTDLYHDLIQIPDTDKTNYPLRYSQHEYNLQQIKMRKLGINVDGQSFEQSVNELLSKFESIKPNIKSLHLGDDVKILIDDIFRFGTITAWSKKHSPNEFGIKFESGEFDWFKHDDIILNKK